jgi:hypothetical protein
MNRRSLFLCLALALVLAGCSLAGIPPSPTATMPPLPILTSPLPTMPPQPTAALPTATVRAPTHTPRPPAPTATAVVIPSSTPGSSKQQTVQIFLVAIGDNGVSGKAIGCGDSLVPVTVPIAPTTGVLRAALNKLLSIKTKDYGESGLYNALYQSNLTAGNIVINNGLATIQLSGTLTLGGECDSPRVKAQLEEIALQFSTVSSVNIFVNGAPLDTLLSTK